MPGIITNPLAQAAQGRAQQAGLQSQMSQQNLWDTILSNYLGLSQDPSVQTSDINWMTGNNQGTSGGLYGNLYNQMTGVAGTVPGTTGIDPGVMNMALGNFQKPMLQEGSSLYYNALNNALGVKVPTVGTQNQMIIGGPASDAFASGVGQAMGSGAASTAVGGGLSTAADFQPTYIPDYQP